MQEAVAVWDDLALPATATALLFSSPVVNMTTRVHVSDVKAYVPSLFVKCKLRLTCKGIHQVHLLVHDVLATDFCPHRSVLGYLCANLIWVAYTLGPLL